MAFFYFQCFQDGKSVLERRVKRVAGIAELAFGFDDDVTGIAAEVLDHRTEGIKIAIGHDEHRASELGGTDIERTVIELGKRFQHLLFFSRIGEKLGDFLKNVLR